jgi:hypothetical protein
MFFSIDMGQSILEPIATFVLQHECGNWNGKQGCVFLMFLFIHKYHHCNMGKMHCWSAKVHCPFKPLPRQKKWPIQDSNVYAESEGECNKNSRIFWKTLTSHVKLLYPAASREKHSGKSHMAGPPC